MPFCTTRPCEDLSGGTHRRPSSSPLPLPLPSPVLLPLLHAMKIPRRPSTARPHPSVEVFADADPTHSETNSFGSSGSSIESIDRSVLPAISEKNVMCFVVEPFVSTGGQRRCVRRAALERRWRRQRVGAEGRVGAGAAAHVEQGGRPRRTRRAGGEMAALADPGGVRGPGVSGLHSLPRSRESGGGSSGGGVPARSVCCRFTVCEHWSFPFFGRRGRHAYVRRSFTLGE